MKIGILTQPLHDNYGGLLQAYALSQKLIKEGHEPIIINRVRDKTNFYTNLKSWIKINILKKQKYIFSKSERIIVSQNTQQFINDFIPNLTKPIMSNDDLLELESYGFEGYIIGSDQCWRPKYSPCISNYYLDFETKSDVLRIAYAASFGTDKWEYSLEQTDLCKLLLKKFDAVSVREDSAVNLCKRYFDATVTHVLDPTMLWDRNFYDNLVATKNIPNSLGNLNVYLLDKTEEKSNLVQKIEKSLNLKSFEVMPKRRIGYTKPINLIDYQYPSPLQWLKGFQDAKFVIADSFHGIVFSIIYNVPFIAIGNENRGMARFSSLLKLFSLESRLILPGSFNEVDQIIKNEIDWYSVNEILKGKMKDSTEFLIKNLN